MGPLTGIQPTGTSYLSCLQTLGGSSPPSLPPDPGPTKAHRASLPCRLLDRFWSFRFNNHKSGVGGVAAKIVSWSFSASVVEAQTVTGYRLGIFQQQINWLESHLSGRLTEIIFVHWVEEISQDLIIT